jgi:hypothetical protein
MREERHDKDEKSRPPYGGSALRASKDPAAPDGAAGHWMRRGLRPLTPHPECSSVIVAGARLDLTLGTHQVFDHVLDVLIVVYLLPPTPQASNSASRQSYHESTSAALGPLVRPTAIAIS